MKYKVLQMRGGAPDKIQLHHDKNKIILIHKDFCNLVDYTAEELVKLFHENTYILPADEGDILHANKLQKEMFNLGVDQSMILLPQVKLDEGYLKIMDYQAVSKDSDFYKNLEEYTGVKYADFKSYTIEEFEKLNINSDDIKVYKTTLGSGSRGVILVNPNRIHLGYKYRNCLVSDEFNKFLSFAIQNNARIMIQDFIPEYAKNGNKLTKINVDFFIRNGKLIGYKWDKTDPSEVFTNWNFGWFYRSNYTDSIMNSLANYLIKKLGIYNAIMNFEAFSDNESETWLIEFNFRYSNSTFEYQAVGVDPISSYIENIDIMRAIPYGENKFTRYWQCKLYLDVENYHNTK